MTLSQHLWFRVLSYIGIFFLSWSVEFLYMLGLGNRIVNNLGLFIFGAFIPFLVSLTLTFKFMRKGHLVGSIALNVINLFFGIALYAFIALVLIGANST
ncbi:hypothetical protein J5U22_01606 [Saccharolobus shibatae]|uniref:Uncharacterized protein n=1 Tax=Saccharolobus shibatae TaxID=2286 RepID=A0A8F5C0S7_9CREN|nr:hypothetical protein J5U22_01606 [Saccharolobus shibatae]